MCVNLDLIIEISVFLLLYSRARTDDMRDVLASDSLRCQVGLMQSHMCVLSPSDHCCGDDSGQKPLFLKPPRSKSTLYLIVSYYPFSTIGCNIIGLIHSHLSCMY